MPHYHFDDDGNLIRPKASDPYDADTVTEPATNSTPKKESLLSLQHRSETVFMV